MRRPDETRSMWNGEQRIYHFANGYGASVIRHDHSYGGREGLWELAVIDAREKLCYDTPIADDVLGWLDDAEVDALLTRIEALPPAGARNLSD